MSNAVAQTIAKASTDMIREAIGRLMTTPDRSREEDMVLGWHIEEMMRRDADFASFIRASV